MAKAPDAEGPNREFGLLFDDGRIRSVGSAVLRLLTAVMIGLVLTGCTAGESVETSPDISAEAETLVSAANDQRWDALAARYPEVVRPQVKIERLISLEEWAEVQAACLMDLGFEVSTTGDGGIVSDTVPPDQAEPYAVAQYRCEARYPVDPRFVAPLTRDEVGELYDYWTGELTACLESSGQFVEPAPSRAKFVDEYLDAGPTWSPYSAVRESAGQTWQEINEECPQVPIGFRGAPK